MRKNKGPTGDYDPRALILEAYRIEGIGPEDCRAIYFDWALGAPVERDMKADTAALLAFVAASVVHQDVPHRARGDGIEVFTVAGR